MYLWKVNTIIACMMTISSTVDSARFTIGYLPALTSGIAVRDADLSAKGNLYAPAIRVALEDLGKRADYTNISHLFNYTIQDNQLDTLVSLKAMGDMSYKQNVSAFIGPEYTCVTEARLAASLNLPMIGYRCADAVLSDKTIYPTFARTMPGAAKVSEPIIAICKNMDWRTISVVKGNTTEWAEVSWTLNLLASENGIKINRNETYSAAYTRFGNDTQLCNIVKSTISSTRIYVFLGKQRHMVLFLRCLNRYAVDFSKQAVIHVSEPDDLYDYTSSDALERLVSGNDLHLPSDTVSDSEIRPFRHLITLCQRHYLSSDYHRFEDATRHYLTLPPYGINPPPPYQIPVSILAAKVYDAVMIYARAVKELLIEGRDPLNGTLIMAKIFNRSYYSIQGYEKMIDINGDAEGAEDGGFTAVSVLNHTGNATVDVVGNFTKSLNGDQLIFQPLTSMSWLNGKPASEPECGFDSEGCPSKMLQNSVIAVSVLVFVAIVAFWAHRQYSHKKNIDSLLWKIDADEIELIIPQPISENCQNGEDQKGNNNEDEIIPWQFLEDGTVEQVNDTLFCPAGYYKNSIVALKYIQNDFHLTSSVKQHLHSLKELNHENINKFIGACINPPQLVIVTHYCDKGSLQDVLFEKRELFLEDIMMQLSLINDLTKGMLYLHASPISCHGNLKSTKCLVDSRLVLQISGFGLHHFRQPGELFTTLRLNQDTVFGVEEDVEFMEKLWTAPELLREPDIRGTQAGDVYSYSIILHEILGMLGPWGETRLTERDIVMQVKAGKRPLLRPNLAVLTCDEYLKQCLEDCWIESPDLRPDFKFIYYRKLKQLRAKLGSNILENMVKRVEKYTHNLESLVEERTYQLRSEKRKTEKLLYRMLPKAVAEDLKRGKQVQAKYYECVTIYFSDIVGFTKLCSESNPYQIVKFLNDLYCCFDNIINNFDVYKVETIGDAYMVVSGLPKPNGDNHAGEIASMALQLLSAMKSFKIHHRSSEQLKLRIGIHSGPVAVGVVGYKMPRYCLFGDTVNTTARMESNGLPLKVHCSAPCKQILDRLAGYCIEKRGFVEMKGKGEVLTYWLLGEDPLIRIRRIADYQHENVLDSACTSTRSSFSDSIHLMPNGFRRSKLAREGPMIDDFRLKPPAARWNLRRGSMPINDYRRGSLGVLDLNVRRGSSPLNQLKKDRKSGSGWEIREDDERKSIIGISPLANPLFIKRASPEGCDSELVKATIEQKTRTGQGSADDSENVSQFSIMITDTTNQIEQTGETDNLEGNLNELMCSA